MVISVDMFRASVAHAVAVLSALISSAQYVGLLGVRRAEWPRYFKKSTNFALCYVGLGAKGSIPEAWKAGKAAFLCCAYDVATDWRSFSEDARIAFEDVLFQMVTAPGTRNLAVDLHSKERHGTLSDDGLERGDIALRFALQVMECEQAREASWPDVAKVGMLLQIVDDVLDLEDDLRTGDTNCLTSARRDKHLWDLLESLDECQTRQYFGKRALVLERVISLARTRASLLLTGQRSPFASAPRSPNNTGGHPIAAITQDIGRR